MLSLVVINRFILADRARKYVTLSKEERREKICKLYSRVFQTDEALRVNALYIMEDIAMLFAILYVINSYKTYLDDIYAPIT